MHAFFRPWQSRFPDHVDDRDPDFLLDPVQEKVGRIAGYRNGVTAAVLQQLRPGQHPVIDRLCLSAQNRRRPVGHIRVGENHRGQMLLVLMGVGPVQDELVKIIGGLGAHPPQNAQPLFAHAPSSFFGF